MSTYETHWCPSCDTKNRVWMDSPDFTGYVECWNCREVWNLKRTSGVERLRDSILEARGMMKGEVGEKEAQFAKEEINGNP